MTRKKRIFVLSASITLGVAGCGCATIADILQNHTDGNATLVPSIFGISGLALIFLAAVYLIFNFTKLLTSELEEKEAKLRAEEGLFPFCPAEENRQSLCEKFIRAGFSEEDGFLYRRNFSFSADYINYFLFVDDRALEDDRGAELCDRADAFLASKKHLRGHCYLYLVSFRPGMDQALLSSLRDRFILQDILQEIPRSMDGTVVLLPYDTEKRGWYLYSRIKPLSAKPLHVAMRQFHKIISHEKAARRSSNAIR